MILVDEFEPDNITQLIRQSVPASVISLNKMHMSDYFFSGYDGTTFQVSRKQAGELVGNVDEAEAQLTDYYPNADVNYQLVEGWISPLPIKGIEIHDHSKASVSVRELGLGQKIYCYQVQPNGKIERGHSFSTINTTMLYAWLHRLDRAGISTYWTTNWTETAKLLVAVYKNEQKPPEEHSTLQRVIKPRIAVKKPEPLMKALMFLSDAYELGVGEKKAKALCDEYVNLMDIAMADVEELSQVPGIGKTIARRVLKALGRTL